MNDFDSDVIVVGAGPTGLMLAAELHLAGVSAIVLDRLAEPIRQSRALGFSARTIEEFGQRGLLPRFGRMDTIPIGHFGGMTMDFTLVDGGHFGVRGIPQSYTESVLADWAGGLGARILRGHDVIGLATTEDAAEVAVTDADGTRRLRARYVVGCDGSRSTVRRLTGIDFPGSDATIEMMTADFAGLPLRLRPVGEVGPAGMAMVLPLGPEAVRIAVYERGTPVRRRAEPPAFEEVAAAFQRVTGEDVTAGKPLWTSYFTDSSRQAAQYRRGRVFLAGDAAHVHLPIGAQGISAGLGDAVNLGWKLAAVLKGQASDDLLDTYHSERHPVATRIIANTLAQRSLYLGGADVQPMRDVFAELLTHEEVRRHLIGMCTGLDIRYDVGGGHPLLGRRLPDQDLLVGDEKTSTYALLHAGRGVLLDLHDSAGLRDTAGPWADRVTAVTATRPDPDAPAASVLVRPDGYIAWLSPGGSADGLADALTRWFGAPAHPGQHTHQEGVRS